MDAASETTSTKTATITARTLTSYVARQLNVLLNAHRSRPDMELTIPEATTALHTGSDHTFRNREMVCI
jgi:hypothetical protein